MILYNKTEQLRDHGYNKIINGLASKMAAYQKLELLALSLRLSTNHVSNCFCRERNEAHNILFFSKLIQILRKLYLLGYLKFGGSKPG